MSKEMHWGGINGKSLFKAVVSDIWMVFAVMVITYLGLGIAGNLRDKPAFTSSATVAVYPFNQMYTLESSSSALETVGTVNEVFNSEMFSMGLNARLAEPADYYLYSHQIDRTSILMLSVSSSSPENAYKILRAAMDYYGEISSHLVGDSYLEILSDPDFPTSPTNDSRILKHRTLLTLLMGFAAVCLLVLMYVMRKTYKSASAIQRCYKNVRFFRTLAPAPNKRSRKNKGKSGSLLNQESMRKTVMELWQMLRAKKGNSVFITSAAYDEGKTDITVSLARGLADLGKTVLILETDPDNTGITEQPDVSDDLKRYTLSEFLEDGTSTENGDGDRREQNIGVVFANSINVEDDFHNIAADVESIFKKAETFADVILVEGCVWTGAAEEQIWKEAADTALAVCRQDKADFNAIDKMMTDLQETNSRFLGCVLYGF